MSREPAATIASDSAATMSADKAVSKTVSREPATTIAVLSAATMPVDNPDNSLDRFSTCLILINAMLYVCLF